MIVLSKKVGKRLNAVVPELVTKTCHGRHYFATECKEVFDLLAEQKEKVIYTYPEKK